MNMLRQFLVGGGVSLVNIAIHALIMTMVVQVARAKGRKRQPHSSLVLIAVICGTGGGRRARDQDRRALARPRLRHNGVT
jgi:hypothetical protein